MKKKYILLVIFLVFVEACVGYGISEQFLQKTIKKNKWLNASSSGQILTVDYAREKLGISNTTASVETVEGDTGTVTPDMTGQIPKMYKGGDTGEGRLVLTANAVQSSCRYQEGKDYTAYAAIDGDYATSWQAEADMSGAGSWLRFELQQKYQISYLTIMPGNWQDEDGAAYYENNRPHMMRVTIGGQAWNLELPDEKVQYRFELVQPILADVVQIEIISVYEGTKENIDCIAEIGIYCTE